MFKFNLKILFASVIVATVLFHSQTLAAKSIYGNSTQNRKISGFSGISVSGNFDIRVLLGTTESVKINTDEGTLEDIETVVENDILIIRYKPRTGWKNGRKVNILINAKIIESLAMSGSGSLKVDGTLKSKNLKTQVSGSGIITLTADATDYIAVLSGSGKIIVKGKVKEAQIVLSGSGNFLGEDLNTENADVKVSGSGNASIAADNKLDAVVSGSGSIHYSGNAEVTKSKSGSGSIVRM
ncbi:MAG: hypothetical protein JWN56_790 [Sphingobacteriales bacterium]|nr:hypothetical protein [Sphingobacteriales bacterium]